MISRRKFIKNGSYLFTIPFLSNNLFTIIDVKDDPELRIRRNVADPKAAKDLQLYRKAVATMKERSKNNPNDPTGWEFQASIHRDFCPHGNWFFLPWHRAYLQYFEQLCRDAAADQTFNLPYWDWTKQPRIPSSFVGQGNPLNDVTRKRGTNDVFQAEFVGDKVLDRIMKLKSFEDFASYKSDKPRDGSGGGTGTLEGNPHNYVHNFINGNMIDANLAALDPLFWLHHANIDRLWANWNESGFLNPNDNEFTNFTFKDNFIDRNGRPIDVICGAMFDNRKIGYKYDIEKTSSASHNPFSSLFVLRSDNLRTSLIEANIVKFESKRVSLVGGAGFINEINDVAKSKTNPNEIKIVLSEIQLPEDENFSVRVFLDYPKKVTSDTPITDPHYVGTIGFFGAKHVHGPNHDMTPKGLTFILDATETLRNIAREKNNKVSFDEMGVQLISIPIDPESKGKLVVDKIAIISVEKQ